MFSTLTSSFSGFFFWLVVARFHPADEVGLVAAIISPLNLIGMFSLMGFDVSLIKYIPEIKDKDNLINTCLSTIFLMSSLLTFLFIAGIEIWSPSLIIIKEDPQFFFLFVILSLILPLRSLQSQGIFVGFRKSKYSFYQAIFTLIRIIFVPFLAIYGSIGIFYSYGLMSLISFVLGIFYLKNIYPIRHKFMINKEIIFKIFNFSCGSYVSRIFETLPTYLLPLLVISLLGAKQNAYFYIAWQISMLPLIFSKAVSNSLFAEILNDKKNSHHLIIKAIKFVSTLVMLSILGTFLFGKYLLMIYGSEYVNNSFELLCVLSFAVIPFSYNTIYVGILRSKGDVLKPIVVNGLIAFFCLGGSYVLVKLYGLIGIAYSWVSANAIVTLLLILNTKNLTSFISPSKDGKKEHI